MGDILKISPDTTVVVPGTSVTYTFSAALTPTEIGQTFIVVLNDIRDNRTGKEEIIFNIGGTALAVVDNFGVYVTSQMLHNPNKRCALMGNVFKIQKVANGATLAWAVRRGLACRKSFLDVVTPPTP